MQSFGGEHGGRQRFRLCMKFWRGRCTPTLTQRTNSRTCTVLEMLIEGLTSTYRWILPHSLAVLPLVPLRPKLLMGSRPVSLEVVERQRRRSNGKSRCTS